MDAANTIQYIGWINDCISPLRDRLLTPKFSHRAISARSQIDLGSLGSDV